MHVYEFGIVGKLMVPAGAKAKAEEVANSIVSDMQRCHGLKDALVHLERELFEGDGDEGSKE